MVLTHKNFLAKGGKWFPKPLINQKKQYFLTQKGPILDMTRKTGYLSYTQTCCWGMGKVNYYCHLMLLLLGK